MAELHLSWCRRCELYRPAFSVRGGICIEHKREQERERYASDKLYRFARLQHSNSRKRRINPVPMIGQEVLLERFDGKCAYCEGAVETWDHIIPLSKGGLTEPGNIVPACKSCNSSKKDKDLIEWLNEKGKDISPDLSDVIVLSECRLG